MEIIKQLNKQELTLKLIGELNSYTAPEFEKVIKSDLYGINSLILDFAELKYLSSAGLRIILVAQKIMNKQGQMVLRHVNKDIREVFDITGFLSILEIED